METDTDDSSFDDFREAKKSSKRRPLLLVIVVVLVLLLVGAGTYAYLNNMLPFQQAQNNPAPQPEGEVAPTEATGEPTAGVDASTTQAPEATSTGSEEAPAEQAETPAPTETPQAEEPQSEAAAPGALLNPPPFGTVSFNQDGASGEWTEKANKLAVNMAIVAPYFWEYLEFDISTRSQDIKAYYIQVLNREMGYRMTFDETYDGGITVIKFKLESRRVTIQFWEGQPNVAPYALIFYEGW